jgi:hypothetical protein
MVPTVHRFHRHQSPLATSMGTAAPHLFPPPGSAETKSPLYPGSPTISKKEPRLGNTTQRTQDQSCAAQTARTETGMLQRWKGMLLSLKLTALGPTWSDLSLKLTALGPTRSATQVRPRQQRRVYRFAYHPRNHRGFALMERKWFVRSSLPLAGNDPCASCEKCGLSRQAKLGRGGCQNELTKPLEKNPVGANPTWSKPQPAGQ